MKERKQSDAEYERSDIQGTTSKEISGPICWSIYHWWSSFYSCGQIMVAKINENLSSCKC